MPLEVGCYRFRSFRLDFFLFFQVPTIEEIGENCTNAKLIEIVQSLPELWDKDNDRFKSSIKASYWRMMAGSKTGGSILFHFFAWDIWNLQDRFSKNDENG